jgi:hypothetical protein
MVNAPPGWWGQAPISGLRVKEQQYRGSDGGYRPYMYDMAGLQRSTNWDGYIGPNGEKFDSKGRIWGQYYEGGAERTLGGAPGAAGFGGSPIPGAGTYGEQMAIAQKAYDNAIAQAKARKTQQFRMGGLLENGTVDPLSRYGTYQSMLQGQGADLDQLLESSYQRGIGGRGLGNQGERLARYQQALQNLGFQREVSSWNQDYANSITQAELERRDRMVAALQAARDNAYGDWGPSGNYGPESNRGPSTTDWTSNLASTVRRRNSLRTRPRSTPSKAELSKYGWGAAATWAKSQPKPKPKPSSPPRQRGGRY